MAEVSTLIKEFETKGLVTFVSKPASQDLGWLQYLLCKYGPEDGARVSHRTVCLKTQFFDVQKMMGWSFPEFERMLETNRVALKLPPRPTHKSEEDCLLQVADALFVDSVYMYTPTHHIRVLPAYPGY